MFYFFFLLQIILSNFFIFNKEHFKRHNNIGQNSSASKPNSFMCIVCRQVLTSNNEYTSHMRHHLRRTNPTASPSQQPTSNPKELFRYSICPIKFENGDDLATHMAKSHQFNSHADEEKPVENSQKIIKEESRSTPPVKISNQALAEFLCEICSSKFESNMKLQAHLLIKHEHQNQQQQFGVI